MKIVKSVFILFVIALSTLLFFALKPIPIPAEEDCLVKEGIVVKIFEGGEKDVVFKLKDTDQLFYINRGLENGLHLTDLNNQLLNKKVIIKYPKYWSPLDPSNTIRHVIKMESKGNIVYNEIE